MTESVLDYMSRLGRDARAASRLLARAATAQKNRALLAAADALGQRQFGRVARAASLFIARHPRYAVHSVRFDAVLIGGLWPRHLPDVWRPPE